MIYNPNSIVLNNMYGGNQYPNTGFQSYQQPGLGNPYYPQNQIAPLYGTTPGYLNYYNQPTYYNPYLFNQQQQAYQQELQKQQNFYIELNKKLSRIAHSYLETPITDDQLAALYEPQPIKEEVLVYEKCAQINQSIEAQQKEFETNTMKSQKERNMEKITEAYESVIPKSCGLVEFLEKAGTLYIESLMAEQRRKDQNLKQLYNSNSYKQTFNQQNPQQPNKYGPIFVNYNTDSMDDETITLPENMRNDFQKVKNTFQNSIEARRNAFFNAIINGGCG